MLCRYLSGRIDRLTTGVVGRRNVLIYLFEFVVNGRFESQVWRLGYTGFFRAVLAALPSLRTPDFECTNHQRPFTAQ